MVTERDDNLHDDGEYHFSDDQVNYEMEDVTTTSSSEEPKPLPPEGVLAKAGNYRRYIIGGVVFIVLIYMVYRMLVPATTSPPTEIAQAPSLPSAATKPAISVQSVTTVTTPQTLPAVPASSTQAMQTPPRPQPTTAPASMPTSQPILVQAQQPSSAIATSSMPADIKTVIDKLSVLEEQNAKLTNALDTNSQKLSSYEAQNAALQSKVLELTTRIASVESGLNQLHQIQGDKPLQAVTPSGNGSSMSSPSAVKPSEPRINYTVQAIIPGRAWLKSDGGDTVTVAEGDVLKNFGKVIKLDPYDGVVEVDTGSRVVTLTYGGGSA